MPNPVDHVCFYSYDGESDSQKKIGMASLVNGKVVYEGLEADRIERAVKGSDFLKPYLKGSGYLLLTQMQFAFTGSYFFATKVQDATIL